MVSAKKIAFTIAVVFMASGALADQTERKNMQQGATGGTKSGQSSMQSTTRQGQATGQQQTTGQRQATSPTAIGVVTMDVTGLHSAQKIMGVQVRDKNGKEIGKIKDLMVNFEGERISYATVAGKDGKTYFVPLSAFTSAHQGNFVTLNADANKLSTSPQPRTGQTEQEYGKQLHEHYGMTYPWENLPGDTSRGQGAVQDSDKTYPPMNQQQQKGGQTR